MVLLKCAYLKKACTTHSSLKRINKNVSTTAFNNIYFLNYPYVYLLIHKEPAKNRPNGKAASPGRYQWLWLGHIHHFFFSATYLSIIIKKEINIVDDK
jgi:hypothetical protein